MEESKRMEKFLNAESVMLVLFITVMIGFWCRKSGMVDDHFDDTMSKIIMTVTCPCVVLNSVLSNQNLPESSLIWMLLGVSIVFFAVTTVIAWAVPMLYPIPRDERGGHAFTICFSNVGFLGFPVCAALLGSDSVLYVAIYNLIANFWIYSFGAHMISTTGPKKMTFKEQLVYMKDNLVSPIMAACVIALILALCNITDDGVIGSTCAMIGNMTAPAVMLVIGSKMATYEIREMMGSPWAYITTFVSLIVKPAVVYAVGMLLLPDPYIVASIVMVVAMPAAMVGPVMCILYGGNLKPLNQGMFLTVLFSLVTIPLVTVFIA